MWVNHMACFLVIYSHACNVNYHQNWSNDPGILIIIYIGILKSITCTRTLCVCLLEIWFINVDFSCILKCCFKTFIIQITRPSPLFVVSEVLCISLFSVCTIIELGQLGRGLPFVDDQILDGAINSISVDIWYVFFLLGAYPWFMGYRKVIRLLISH